VSGFKFVHCADLHLGGRFSGVSSRDPGLGERLTESAFASFHRIVDLAISEGASLMVISGDVFDESGESPDTRYRFARELERLGAPCVIALGNHDFKRSWEKSIPYPPNAHVFPAEPERIELELGGERVEVVGRSFSSRHTGENLAASLRGSGGAFTIAVVHCDLDSAEGRYAPCQPADLVGKGVDYWALGHIHARRLVRERPHAAYPGNIQGRNPKEKGEKGAYVVEVSGGAVAGMRFAPTQEILWADARVDITGKDMGGLMRAIRRECEPGSIVSLEITGKGDLDEALRLDPSLADRVAREAGCIVSSIDLRTSPPIDLSSLPPNGILAKVAEAGGAAAAMDREALISRICRTRASASIRGAFEGMSDDELRAMARDAELLLIDRIAGGSA
jgi:DNA repair exonuclease SbcCD nuclease subunit